MMMVGNGDGVVEAEMRDAKNDTMQNNVNWLWL
jgi:hypothetical protein